MRSSGPRITGRQTLAQATFPQFNTGMSNSAIAIRPARATDISVIGEITVRSWQHTFVGLLPHEFLSSLTPAAQQHRHAHAFMRPGVSYHVAADGDEVIGFTSWGPGRDPAFPGMNELYAIYLKPGFERRGIGQRLFDRVIAQIAASGPSALYLTALAMNPNRAFYTRLRGVEVDASDIQLGSSSYPQVAFLWPKPSTGPKAETR